MIDDLFEPIAAIPGLNQALMDQAVKDNPEYDRGFVWTAIRQDYRDKVNERWLQVRQFCESNFVSEFRDKEKFNSRLWELNLRYLFESQLIIAPGDGEPDLITYNYVVECVVPDPTGVPDMVFDGKEYDYPTDEIGRRVTAALVAKLAQFTDRTSKTSSRLDYTKTPYLVAVGLPQREFRDAKSMSGMDIVETMLVGAGPLQVTIDWTNNSGKVSVSSRSAMQTRNGTDYDIAYFQRDEWKNISAVMWSAEWLPEIGDIKVLVNPNATIPLSPEAMRVAANTITYTKTDTGYTRDQKLDQ